jgi:hypothetical protein
MYVILGAAEVLSADLEAQVTAAGGGMESPEVSEQGTAVSGDAETFFSFQWASGAIQAPDARQLG